MPVTAKLRYLHIAPRKVRLVADLIRKKRAEQAQAILNFAGKRASQPLLKLLKQAIANAKNNFQMEPANLFISEVKVDEGPKFKRWRARARGQAYEIQKKTSHITLMLEEVVKKAKKVKKTSKAKAAEQAEERIEKEVKLEEPVKEEKAPREQAKFRPQEERKKPQSEKGLRRIFRRKTF